MYLKNALLGILPFFALSSMVFADYRSDQFERERQNQLYQQNLYYRAGAGYGYGYGYGPGYYQQGPGYVVPYPNYNPYSNPLGFDYDTNDIYDRNLNK